MFIGALISLMFSFFGMLSNLSDQVVRAEGKEGSKRSIHKSMDPGAKERPSDKFINGAGGLRQKERACFAPWYF